jgi:hypothetical protein
VLQARPVQTSALTYENHVDMLQEQLKREPYPAPQFAISERVPSLAQTGNFEPEWLERFSRVTSALLATNITHRLQLRRRSEGSYHASKVTPLLLLSARGTGALRRSTAGRTTRAG